MCLHRVRRFPLHVPLITHQHKDGGCVYVEAGPLFLRLLALTACHTLDPHRQAVAGELASDQPPPSWDRHAASLPRRIYFEHPGNLLLCYLSRQLTLFVFFVFSCPPALSAANELPGCCHGRLETLELLMEKSGKTQP